ncbi:transcriptional regulator, partial [Planktomarina temperata]|nr:transcriptional regulator [Planktomarina temperata]
GLTAVETGAALGARVIAVARGPEKLQVCKAQKKNILEDKEALDLVRCYYAIPEHQRKRLFDLARVLSDAA